MRPTSALLAAAAALLASCAAGVAGSPSASVAESASPAATATVAATSTVAATPMPGCLPLCIPPQLTSPGAVPAGAYASRYFFGGNLVVTIPGEGWVSQEDSTGELAFQLGDDDQSTLDFWIDIYPVVDGTDPPEPVEGFDGTASGMLDWIAANPNLKVLNRRTGSLAGLSAEVIDFVRSPKAKNVDPGCPEIGRPCVGMFGFQEWDGFYSQGGPFKLRMFAADAMWGGTPHVVYAMITTADPDGFKAFAPVATTMVEGAHPPAGVSQ
jgi:hypothetical protein